jgi:hypothetical protein
MLAMWTLYTRPPLADFIENRTAPSLVRGNPVVKHRRDDFGLPILWQSQDRYSMQDSDGIKPFQSDFTGIG